MSQLKNVFFGLGLLSIFSCSAMQPEETVATRNEDSAVRRDAVAALQPSEPVVSIEDELAERGRIAPARTEALPRLTFDGLHLEGISERVTPRSPRRYSLPIMEVPRLLPTDTKVILSIDGGGSRGIIPLFYIQELKRHLEMESLNVDMIAGTSVGALIGAAVALNKENELYERFPEFLRQTFSESKSARAGGGLFRPRYKSSGRRGAIESFVGDMKASDLPVDFIVPYYCYNTGEARIYKSFSPESGDFRLLDLLMMTSAAPTYFNPHKCSALHGAKYEGGDGGIFANDPALAAYIRAKERYPHSKIKMISLGTGMPNQSKAPGYYYNLGLVKWAEIFSDISISGSAAYCDALMDFMATQGDPNFEYVRIQTHLTEDMLKMDDVSEAQLEMRRDSARSNIRGAARIHFERALEILRERELGRRKEERRTSA
jgi:hypothetical protein